MELSVLYWPKRASSDIQPPLTGFIIIAVTVQFVSCNKYRKGAIRPNDLREGRTSLPLLYYLDL